MLYLIPTPIGNLKDITLRAIEILRDVELIVAEDTRVSGKLLKHLDISKPLRSLHQNNEHAKVNEICDLAKSKDIAYITDAGTPGISDPGFLLVRACIKEGINVECLPGPTAFVPALAVSGLPMDTFYFEGFLPHKKGRSTRLKHVSELTCTTILYESPHRIQKCISQLIEHCGPDRRACIVRELSKMHEEKIYGTLEDIQKTIADRTIKGEIVVVIEGKR